MNLQNLDIVTVQCPDPRQFLKEFIDYDIGEQFYDNFFDLIQEQHYWLKIKNKNVFYNHREKALIPDLAIYTAQSSPTILPCPVYSSLSFEGYKGEIMTRDDFLFCFSVDYYDFLVDKFNFKKYDNFTIAEDYYVDRKCSYVGDWGSFSLQCSHHIPIYKFEKQKDSLETSVDIYSYYISLLYLLGDGLIPDGLTPESELAYTFLLKLYSLNPSIVALDQWNDLEFREDNVTDSFLIEIKPLIEEYLMENVKLMSFTENTQGKIGGRKNHTLPQIMTKT